MADKSLLEKTAQFDLAATVDKATANFAGVPTGSSVATKVKAIAKNPRKLAALVGIVLGLSGVIAALALSGALAAIYESIYTLWPGRPWTHVMRERPWIYVVLAVAFSWLPFTLSPPHRWGRAFLSYCFFLTGFLAGHVFW